MCVVYLYSFIHLDIHLYIRRLCCDSHHQLNISWTLSIHLFLQLLHQNCSIAPRCVTRSNCWSILWFWWAAQSSKWLSCPASDHWTLYSYIVHSNNDPRYTHTKIIFWLKSHERVTVFMNEKFWNTKYMLGTS